jgi:putative peptidoglycan lipid II flippase
MVLVLGTAIIFAEIFAPYYIRLYFNPASPEGILATRITRILLPGQLFFFAGGVLTAVLLVRKQFTFQALTPLIYNLCIIAGGALLASRMGIASLGVGALAGAYLGAFLLNAYGAYRAGMRYQPILNFKHPGLREWVRLSLPLMLGVTVITLDSQISGFFASHGSGDISRLAYAKKLFTAPMAIIGQAAGAASLPFFASLYGRNQFDAFRSAVNRSVSRLIAFSFLGSAAMIALARPAVDIIFRRGSFHAADATSTASYFAIFAISLALWTAQAIYARAFYAAGETFVPMLAGTIVTLITIPIYWTLHRHFNVIGLAWASDLAIILHTTTLAILLHRRKMVPLFGPSGGLDRTEILRAAAAAIISFAGTSLLLHLIHQKQTYLGDIIDLILGGIVWATLAIATLHLTGSKLLIQLRSRIG